MANWVKAATQKALEVPLPRPSVDDDTVVEVDELFTFVQAKNETFVVTQVHRKTRCFMSWLVVTERTTESMQPIVDGAPIAFQYCADGLTTHEALNYRTGLHLVAHGKSQTYSVEGGNADLRHYLARLALAKKSRCFSRCMDALKRNIALFIQCWNRRQLFKQAYPACNPPLRQFVSIWL